ncbi:ribose-phosphate pyrophosphokinase [Phenylobacterium sp.]|uniref:ribose-phosphate pyrophosphokinase n=1 Tax=Phenylobacterium sp. TaxID=1871053 RepID=UPI002733781F|nr:ribose-phosphate pyrophosphokinase [Phenylobacterium sp.]MDP3853331.1 ribose-phosphate pyrophosphokinase [Phenylobacterium sp.]
MRLILPLPGNEAFASQLARAVGGDLGELETRRFPDGEHYVRLRSDPAGRTVDLVCTLARIDEVFLSLIFAADAARGLGAREVNLIAPYLGYMRQDSRFQPGEAVTSTSIARLLSGSFDRLVTVDPHLHRYASLNEVYAIPSLALHAAPLLGRWIRESVTDPLVIGPDAESEQWAAAVAAAAGAPHLVLSKTRLGDHDVRITLPDLSRHRGRQPVLIDDIASSGHTLLAAAQQLVAVGFPAPDCAVVHAIFGGDAFAQVSAVAGRVVSTDSVAHPSNALPLAPLIAQALAAAQPAPE